MDQGAAGGTASDGAVRDVADLGEITPETLAERLCLQEWLDNLDPAFLEAVWREAELPEPPR